MHTFGGVKLKATIDNVSRPTFHGSLTSHIFIKFLSLGHFFPVTIRARAMKLKSHIHLKE